MELKDNMIAMRGEILVRTLDLKGNCLHRYENRNTITYVAPLVIMDLLQQKGLDAGINESASHPADVARGFGAAVNVITNPNHNAIRYMRIGRNNQAAQRSDSTLVDQIGPASDDGTEIVSDILFPSNAAIRFVALFGAAKANVSPLTIEEVSLWTRGNTFTEDLGAAGFLNSRMFARQIHAPIPKTAALQLEYTWTIYLT